MRPSWRPPQTGWWWSPADPIVVTLAVTLTVWGWTYVGPVAGTVLVITGHFLLFCNVIRLRQFRELVWAAAFLWTTGCLLLNGVSHWLPILAAILPVTATLVIEEVRSPGYRGLRLG